MIEKKREKKMHTYTDKGKWAEKKKKKKTKRKENKKAEKDSNAGWKTAFEHVNCVQTSRLYFI